MATLKDVKRIVIKVGTSTLTHHTGKSNIRQIKKLVAVISDIVNSGVEVALVTSGAIGVGVVSWDFAIDRLIRQASRQRQLSVSAS